MRSKERFWKLIRGWLPRYPLHVHTNLNNLYRHAYARKRWIFFFIICVNLGVIGYVAFFRLFGQPVDKVIYVVYVDDFSIYIDDELVFEDEINSTDLEERGWWKNSRIQVTDENYSSPPYSIASLYTYGESGHLVGGQIGIPVNISEGWKTLNITWYVMVPNSNWAPSQSYSSGLWLRCHWNNHITSYRAGIQWVRNPQREPNPWTESFQIYPGMTALPYDPVTFEFDHWHRLSLVLNSTSKLGCLYLDGEIVSERSLELEYLEWLEIGSWRP